MSSKEICRPRPAPEAASKLELIARAQQGEEAAFFALYERHKKRIYAICLHVAGMPDKAEDLTRYIFLRIFRNIGAFEKDSEFATALEKFAIRVAIALRRQRPFAQPLFTCEESAADAALAEVARNRTSPCQPDAGNGARREELLLSQLLGFDIGSSLWRYCARLRLWKSLSVWFERDSAPVIR